MERTRPSIGVITISAAIAPRRITARTSTKASARQSHGDSAPRVSRPHNSDILIDMVDRLITATTVHRIKTTLYNCDALDATLAAPPSESSPIRQRQHHVLLPRILR